MNIKQTKIHHSRLIERRERGDEENIIVRASEAPHTPAAGERIARHPGRFVGEMNVTSAFFETLADDDLASWEGSSEPMK